MTPPTIEQLNAIQRLAIQTVHSQAHEELDSVVTIAKHYCNLRAKGESRARAELLTFSESARIVNAPSIREKNIVVRRGLEIGIDAWFEAFKEVTGSQPNPGKC